uniref:Uncharacterized protein n=1 Tax=Octactis speculum TaxID=3111310 RepID=A0A7S2DPY2_9STRA
MVLTFSSVSKEPAPKEPVVPVEIPAKEPVSGVENPAKEDDDDDDDDTEAAAAAATAAAKEEPVPVISSYEELKRGDLVTFCVYFSLLGEGGKRGNNNDVSLRRNQHKYHACELSATGGVLRNGSGKVKSLADQVGWATPSDTTTATTSLTAPSTTLSDPPPDTTSSTTTTPPSTPSAASSTTTMTTPNTPPFATPSNTTMTSPNTPSVYFTPPSTPLKDGGNASKGVDVAGGAVGVVLPFSLSQSIDEFRSGDDIEYLIVEAAAAATESFPGTMAPFSGEAHAVAVQHKAFAESRGRSSIKKQKTGLAMPKAQYKMARGPDATGHGFERGWRYGPDEEVAAAAVANESNEAEDKPSESDETPAAVIVPDDATTVATNA